MYAIEFQQPKTLADAASVLASTGGRPLAGGQSLVAAMKLRLSQPGTLVDLGGIPDLKGIRRDGEHLVIGAMSRHAEIAFRQLEWVARVLSRAGDQHAAAFPQHPPRDFDIGRSNAFGGFETAGPEKCRNDRRN